MPHPAPPRPPRAGGLPPLTDLSRRGRLPRAARPVVFAAGVLVVWVVIIRVLAPEMIPDLTGAGFSDPRTRTRQIESAARLIDTSIAQAVRVVAPGTRVLSEDEKQNAVNGVAWRSRRVELQLPPSVQSGKVARALTRLPYDTRWAITMETFRLEPYSETVQIAVHGYPTHLVTLYDTLAEAGPVHVDPRDPPRVAILIDDLGYHATRLDPLWNLDATFSVAILPFSPYALAAAETAEAHQKEILVHLPMEPLPDLTRPRRARILGQLTLAMSLDEIRRRTLRALRAVPYAVGVNNHEGSAFMRSPRHVRAVLEVVKAERMFFVDSRTTARSRGLAEARALGVPVTDRQVFLDNDASPDRIRRWLARLGDIAFRRGSALGIGHPNRTTIRVLADWLPTADSLGLRLVPVSALTTLGEEHIPTGQHAEGQDGPR